MNSPLSPLAVPSPLSLRAARYGRGDNACRRRRCGDRVRWDGLLRGRLISEMRIVGWALAGRTLRRALGFELGMAADPPSFAAFRRSIHFNFDSCWRNTDKRWRLISSSRLC